MAKLNGTNMIVFVNGVPIGGTKSFTLDITQENPDASSRDSAGWTERIAGRRDWSISFDGLFDPAGTLNAEEIYDLIAARSLVTLEFATVQTGGLVFSGSGYANGLSISAPDEDVVTISGGFEGSGALAKGTIAGS
jgi:predicted secreted protein